MAPVGSPTEEPEQTSTRDELRDFIARLVGWDDKARVEHALHAVRLATSHQAALVFCGEGDLVPVARGLHRHVLSDERPFVLFDPRRRATGADAIDAAIGGTVCLRSKRLPRDLTEPGAGGPRRARPARHLRVATAQAHGAGARADQDPSTGDQAPRDRPDHRCVRPRCQGGAADLSAAHRRRSPLVRTHSATSLPEIEKGAWRLVALREAGTVARAAERLDMSHAALGEWFAHRRQKRAKRSPARRAG